MNIIELSVFDCDIRVECVDRQAESLLNSNYGWFKKRIEEAQITYRITRQGAGLLAQIQHVANCPLVRPGVRREPVHLQVFLVGENDAAFCVVHLQALTHVVEGGIELLMFSPRLA